MTSYHGIILGRMDIFWSNIQKFFYSHKTLFEIGFLLIYAMEQLLLFSLIFIRPDLAHVFAGLIALLLLTTISFEKIAMQSRYTLLRDNALDYSIERQSLIEANISLQEDNGKLNRIVKSLRKKANL